MIDKKYKVFLTPPQRMELEKITRKGKISVRTLKRARILLLSDESDSHRPETTVKTSETVGVCLMTVIRIRKRFCKEGLNSIHDKPRSGTPTKLNGRQKAELTAIACSDPPKGRERWTLDLLRERMIELKLVESVSSKTIGRFLKKKD